eukprot:scaffold334292_cov18-Prasinocladus_malaysianus.AAC.1
MRFAADCCVSNGAMRPRRARCDQLVKSAVIILERAALRCLFLCARLLDAFLWPAVTTWSRTDSHLTA